MRTLTLSLLAGASLLASANAQRLAAYTPGPGIGFAEVQPPSPVFPGPVPPIPVYPSVPVLPPVVAPFPVLPGDSSFNNRTGLHWFTNGLVLLPLLFPIGAGPLYNQNFSFCPADPTGFVFSPTQSIYAAGF